MAASFAALEQLPTQNASQVKNRWGEVTRQVREQGSVAITSHSSVDLVMLSAPAYRALFELASRAQAQEASALEELSHNFKQRLASLNEPGARSKVSALLAAKGVSKTPPIAGETF
jgi:PHD/YefM family antitoxin component YafN of YafNO toxin-antitoxin module